MKKITVALMSLLLVLAGCSTAKEETGTVASTDLPEIGVITLMEHTSLNQIQDAFTEQMKALGYEDGVNCKFD